LALRSLPRRHSATDAGRVSSRDGDAPSLAAAALSDDDIDRLINQAQQEAEPRLG
jgi:hypothetical protein